MIKDQVFRPALLVLLLLIVILQGLALVPSAKSEQCQNAIETGLAEASSREDDLVVLLSQYDVAVYDRAENINQQSFLANEYQFEALKLISFQTSALLRIAAACQ